MMVHVFFFLMIRRPPRSTLFPYTTPSDLAPVLNLCRHVCLSPATSSALSSRSPASRARGRRCRDRKSTRLNSSHANISYAVFCLKKKKYFIHHVTSILMLRIFTVSILLSLLSTGDVW